jgi:uncharacterized protein YdeI (BOF family)
MNYSRQPKISAIAACVGLAIGAASLAGYAQSQSQSQQSGSEQAQQSQPRGESARQAQSQQGQSARQSQSSAAKERTSGSQSASSTSGSANSNAQAAGGQEKKSMGPNPYAQADDSWISLSGTVGQVRRDTFELDFGGRTITVEMDDSDRQAETYALRMGDKVTVNGVIDDDFFETSKIEASSVYVEKLGRHFFASVLDEEDFVSVTYLAPIDDGGVAVHGLVTEVSGDEFTIDNGLRSVRIDVGDMSYDPLDDEGYQKVEVGDVVRVQGKIDDDFLEAREVMASSITTLAEEIG